MKPEKASVEDITALRPVCLRRTVPEAYLDLNNHMNMRWYVALFDDAGDTLPQAVGRRNSVSVRSSMRLISRIKELRNQTR